jgi:hypothetical protein
MKSAGLTLNLASPFDDFPGRCVRVPRRVRRALVCADAASVMWSVRLLRHKTLAGVIMSYTDTDSDGSRRTDESSAFERLVAQQDDSVFRVCHLIVQLARAIRYLVSFGSIVTPEADVAETKALYVACAR